MDGLLSWLGDQWSAAAVWSDQTPTNGALIIIAIFAVVLNNLNRNR